MVTLTKNDSRSTFMVATSISTPCKMSVLLQVERRVFRLPGSTTSSQEKGDLLEDCNPNIDNARWMTGFMSNAAAVEPICA